MHFRVQSWTIHMSSFQSDCVYSIKFPLCASTDSNFLVFLKAPKEPLFVLFLDKTRRMLTYL